MLSYLKTMVRKSPALERLGHSLLNKRYQLAKRYLRGTGLEIGALDRPLYLPKTATAYYLDRMLPAQLREHYPELGSRKLFVSMVADGEDLSCIADGSLSFLIANHVIEHLEDPIAAIELFLQKLKAGGILYMAVPDMRRTFDHQRAETTWEHLSGDHAWGPQGSRVTHFNEWVQLVENLTGEAAAKRSAELQAQNYSIHFHCWTCSGFEAFLSRLSESVPLKLIETQSWRNENIFVMRKELMAL